MIGGRSNAGSETGPRELALVTGAAAGIGASFAELLAREGFDLVLLDKDATVTARASELAARHGVEALAIVQDLGAPGAADAVWERCQSLDRPVSFLVNNAGYHLNKLFHQQTWAELDDNVEVLLTVVVELTHRFLPAMLQRGRGTILNVSSVSGLMPGGRRLATYASSKAFLVRFSEALDLELEGTGVNVSVLCPGFTKTNLFVSCGLTDVRDSVPPFMWQTADEVALEGYRAATKKVPVHVSGRLNDLVITAAKILPRPLVRERTRILHKAAHNQTPAGGGAAGNHSPVKDRAALVTGPRDGIGGRFAEVLASEGYNIVLVDRDARSLEERTADLARRHGVGARCIVQDLADPRAPAAIRAACDAIGWPVDVLVNDGGAPTAAVFRDLSWSAVEAAVHARVVAPTHLTYLFLPGMIARGHGRVVNLASVAGFEPGSYGKTIECSVNAYLISLSESVNAELSDTGVHVTAVCPGLATTEGIAEAGMRGVEKGGPLRIVGGIGAQAQATLLQMAPRRPMGRFLSRGHGGT